MIKTSARTGNLSFSLLIATASLAIALEKKEDPDFGSIRSENVELWNLGIGGRDEDTMLSRGTVIRLLDRKVTVDDRYEAPRWIQIKVVMEPQNNELKGKTGWIILDATSFREQYDPVTNQVTDYMTHWSPPAESQAAAPKEREKSARGTLKAYLDDLRASPYDKDLRAKIISLVAGMKPKPAVPEDAERHAARGAAALKEAQDAKDLAEAVSEFQQASLAAPWVGEIYYNLAVVQSKAGDDAGAAESLKLCLLASPKDKDTKQLQYEIDFRLEKAAKEASPEGQAEIRAKRFELVRQAMGGGVEAPRLERTYLAGFAGGFAAYPDVQHSDLFPYAFSMSDNKVSFILSARGIKGKYAGDDLLIRYFGHSIGIAYQSIKLDGTQTETICAWQGCDARYEVRVIPDGSDKLIGVKDKEGNLAVVSLNDLYRLRVYEADRHDWKGADPVRLKSIFNFDPERCVSFAFFSQRAFDALKNPNAPTTDVLPIYVVRVGTCARGDQPLGDSGHVVRYNGGDLEIE